MSVQCLVNGTNTDNRGIVLKTTRIRIEQGMLRDSIEENIAVLKELPTAWVCSSDYVAIILNSILNKHGLFSPKDFSIVG
jgi:DNA-binding LacI/PurR family transcriptional regulator